MALNQIIYLSVAGGLLLSLPIIAIIIIYTLSKMDFIFTSMREGTGCAVVTGTDPKRAKFVRFILAYTDHYLKYDSRLGVDIITLDRNHVENIGVFTTLINRFGIYYLGIPFLEHRYTHKFWWQETDNTNHMIPRHALTDFFYANQFPYMGISEAAETLENWEVTLEFMPYIQILCPTITLFRNDQWFKSVLYYLSDIARRYVGANHYDDLKKSNDSTSLLKMIQDNSNHLLTEFGVVVRGVSIAKVTIVGEQSLAQKEASTKKAIAEINKEVAAIDAKAKELTLKPYLSEGAAGRYMRHQEAMEKAGALGNAVYFDNDSSTGDNMKKDIIKGTIAGNNASKGDPDENSQ